MSTIGSHYRFQLNQIEEKIQKLEIKWYQKWWGILILGIIASVIVMIISNFI